jgi:hypothetical protein
MLLVTDMWLGRVVLLSRLGLMRAMMQAQKARVMNLLM